MTKLRLSDIKNVLEEDLPYAVIVDYLRFLSAFGRGTRATALDADLMAALKVDYPSTASVKLSNLYREGLLRREEGQSTQMGRKPLAYYAPK